MLRNKILVTGATGFIGIHLVSKLKKLGFSVTGLSLKGDSKKTVSLNLLNKGKVEQFLQNNQFDYIVHLAAALPSESQSELSVYLENVRMTANLLEAFSKSTVQRFIFASSVAAFIQPSSLYGLSKLAGEALCSFYAEKPGKSVISLRISSPFGPGNDRNTVINKFLRSSKSNKNLVVYGKGKRSQDFIFIDDVVSIFIKAIKSEKSGIYNGGSGKSISTLALAKTIIKAQKSDSKIVFQGEDPQESYFLKLSMYKTNRDLNYKPKYSLIAGLKKSIKELK